MSYFVLFCFLIIEIWFEHCPLMYKLPGCIKITKSGSDVTFIYCSGPYTRCINMSSTRLAAPHDGRLGVHVCAICCCCRADVHKGDVEHDGDDIGRESGERERERAVERGRSWVSINRDSENMECSLELRSDCTPKCSVQIFLCI